MEYLRQARTPAIEHDADPGRPQVDDPESRAVLRGASIDRLSTKRDDRSSSGRLFVFARTVPTLPPRTYVPCPVVVRGSVMPPARISALI